MAFGYYRTITLDHTQAGSSDTSDWPLLFSFTEADFATVAHGGVVQNSSGYDICFSSDLAGATLLSWEMVSYDATTGTVLAWVKVPTLSHSTNTVIYVQYGDATISTFQGGSHGAAWNSGYWQVYHLGENGHPYADATVNAEDSTSTTNDPTQATGLWGKAQSFNGTSQYIQAPNFANPQNPMTGSFWAKWPSGQAHSFFGFDTRSNGSFTGWVTAADVSNGTKPTVYVNNFGPISDASALNDNAWHYWTAVLDSTSLRLYIDGSVVATLSGSHTPATSSAGSVNIGAAAGLTDYGQQTTQEVRLSGVALTDDQITADYNSQKSGSTFTTLGSQQAHVSAIEPTGIASGLAFGSPSMTGGNLQIYPGGIASGLAFGVPLIAGGAILPTGIPSGFAAGTPFMRQQVKLQPAITLSPLTLGGIPSGFAAGTPRVAFVKIIQPALSLSPLTLGGIPSGFAAGTPSLNGAAQFITIQGIASGFAAGTPTMIGGTGFPILLIGGIDRTSYWNPMGAGTNMQATTIQSQAIGRATFTFDMIVLDQSFKPAVGQTVRFLENGLTLFAGCIDTVAKDWEASTTGVVTYHITALDKSSICDHRVATTPSYPSGSDIVTVIQTVVTNYLNGEGITTQMLPSVGSLGSLTSPLNPGYLTVTDLFNQLATLSGTVWWVDFNGALHFSTSGDLPAAPFSLTATSGQYRHPVASVSLSGAGQTSGYRNKQYVVTNLNVLPGSGTGGSASAGSGVTETFDWHAGNQGIITNPNGSQYLQVSLPIGSVQSMTVNGHVQTVSNLETLSGPTTHGDPNDEGWLYVPGYPQLTFTFGPPPDHATIVVTYVPGTQTNQTTVQVGTALSPVDPFGSTFGTCGSGIYENIQQVQNISTQAGLDEVAAGVLERAGGVPTIFQFETDKAGLFVGQILTVNIPVIDLVGPLGANILLLITHVSASAASEQPLAYGSRFHWNVTATSILDPGNWVTYFTNLIARTNNPLPVLQYEVATIVLAPGGSISSGIVSTNPTYVDRTGLMVEIYGGAATAPVDQNLTLTVTDITEGIVLGSITIPAGSTAQHTYTFPQGSQIYVFAKDQLTVTATYAVTGANPVAASGVTLKIRWAM